MIITIARESGSGGHEVGKKLAEHYHLPLYDKEILVEKAKEKGILDEMESFFSEKPMNSLLYAIAIENGTDQSWHKEFDILKSLIEEESFVLIGRCGNYIYRDRDDCLSFFLHSDRTHRVQRTMGLQKLNEKKASHLIDEVDEKRSTFHKYYTGEHWGDGRNYTMCLDTDRIGEEHTLKVLIDYIDSAVR